MTPLDPVVEAALRSALAFLAAAPAVRYAEVRLVDEEAERLRVVDGRPEAVQTAETAGVGVRVLGPLAWGFACTADLTEGGVVAAARAALAVALASGALAKDKALLPEAPARVGTHETPVRVDPFSVPLDEKIALLTAPVRALLAEGAPVAHAEAWMEWSRVRKRLLTTEGTDTDQRLTHGACGMHVIAVGDDGAIQKRSYPTWHGGEGFQGGYEVVHALDLAGNVARLADEARALLAAPPCPAGDATLLLESSQVALQIHESCGHPTELDRVMGSEISLAGGSFLQPHLLGGFRYGSPLVTLTADAVAPGGNGTFGWDDEGTPAGTHDLVREGLFVDYLSSRETGAALGRPSTGTMRAESWNRIPLIRMVNVSLAPGADDAGDLDALVADTEDGVLMATDKSWSIDDVRLNFQFSCEIAWEIKRGKRTRILRDPVYTGVTPQFWRGCDAVCGPEEFRLWGINSCGKGDPIQTMRVGHGAAPARFRGVTVGSSGDARAT